MNQIYKPQKGKSKTIDLTSSDSESDAPLVRSGPYKKSSLDTPRPCQSSTSAAKKRRAEDESDMEENRVATDECVFILHTVRLNIEHFCNSLIKSKDAYMLVYVRRDITDEMEVDQPEIPSIVQQKLQEIDRELTVRLEEYVADERECHKKFNTKRDEKRAVYHVWNEPSDVEQALLVDKDALQAWLTAELTPDKKDLNGKAKRDSSKVDGKASADDSGSDCVEVTSKRVSQDCPNEERSKVNGHEFGAGMTLPKEDQLPARRPISRKQFKPPKTPDNDSGIDEDSPDLPTVFPNMRSAESTDHALSGLHESVANGHTQASGSMNGEGTTHSVSKGDGSRRKEVRQVRKIWSENLLCPHGNVRPSATSQMKRISPAGVALLVAADVEIGPELLTPDNLCRQCVFEPIQGECALLDTGIAEK